MTARIWIVCAFVVLSGILAALAFVLFRAAENVSLTEGSSERVSTSARLTYTRAREQCDHNEVKDGLESFARAGKLASECGDHGLEFESLVQKANMEIYYLNDRKAAVDDYMSAWDLFTKYKLESPYAAMVETRLIGELLALGRFEEAERHLRETIELVKRREINIPESDLGRLEILLSLAKKKQPLPEQVYENKRKNSL